MRERENSNYTAENCVRSTVGVCWGGVCGTQRNVHCALECLICVEGLAAVNVKE